LLQWPFKIASVKRFEHKKLDAGPMADLGARLTAAHCDGAGKDFF